YAERETVSEVSFPGPFRLRGYHSCRFLGGESRTRALRVDMALKLPTVYINGQTLFFFLFRQCMPTLLTLWVEISTCKGVSALPESVHKYGDHRAEVAKERPA